MSVLDSIIEGVREDLAARRKPLAQLQEAMDAHFLSCTVGSMPSSSALHVLSTRGFLS